MIDLRQKAVNHNKSIKAKQKARKQAIKELDLAITKLAVMVAIGKIVEYNKPTNRIKRFFNRMF